MFIKKAIIAIAALCISTQAWADTQTRVLYLEVDQGRDMLERNNPAFRRIFDHTGNYLHHENIKVLEEGRSAESGARSFGDAMDIVSRVKRNKLDAVVLVSVKRQQDHQGTRVKDRMVAVAEIIDAHTLEIVDTLRVQSPQATSKAGACERECRDFISRRHVREILPEFSEKLARRLQGYRPVMAQVVDSDPQLTLTLKGFKPREVRFLEDRIVNLESTRDLSSLTSSPDKPTFWLERRKDAGNVRDDLSKVLAQLDLKARIIQTKRQVTLVKVSQDMAYLD